MGRRGGRGKKGMERRGRGEKGKNWKRGKKGKGTCGCIVVKSKSGAIPRIHDPWVLTYACSFSGIREIPVMATESTGVTAP